LVRRECGQGGEALLHLSYSNGGWSSTSPVYDETPKPSVSDPLLTPDRIRAYLIEVAELLPDGSPQCIVVVGGSLLALLGFREATNDVDSIKRLGTSLKDAVAQVADRHGLAPRWLNDSAAGFAPQTFDESACTVELDHPRLRVLGAPLQQVFVMKLFAGRALDITDLSIIWSACGFESPEQAADLYHAAYPHLEWDEYLVDEIRAIGERGSGARTIRLGDVDPEL
jgi:hypothetical protein